jgi:hypothetical protein
MPKRWKTGNKKPAGAGFSSIGCSLSLAELRSATCFSQTHLLSLDLTGVTGNKAFGSEARSQRLIVVHQRSG